MYQFPGELAQVARHWGQHCGLSSRLHANGTFFPTAGEPESKQLDAVGETLP
jgi:hypothetical protein